MPAWRRRRTPNWPAFVRTAERKTAKRKSAKPQQEQAATPVQTAYAQIGGTPVQSLDTITVAASKTEERAIDALAPVSVVTLDQIQGLQPKRLADIFYNVPGVSALGDHCADLQHGAGLEHAFGAEARSRCQDRARR